MASRRRPKPKRSFALNVAIACAAACVLAGVVGFGVASASVAGLDESTVGLGSSAKFQTSIKLSSSVVTSESLEAAAAASSASNTNGSSATSFDGALTERNTLRSAARCDITTGLDALTARIEEERRIAEEQARIAEQQHIQEVQRKQQAYGGLSALSEVDFSVGEEAFVQEWTQRIDDYLAGSALAGHGADFAQAAWDYGVDPRWSPAISNTESSKGSFCFLSHNAWGWGSSSWSNWTDAIWAHVKGLSDGYGYSITQYAAETYCPPNSTNWYNNTLSEMRKI